MPSAVAAELLAKATARERDGETIVWVSRGADTEGFIALRDEIDPTARLAVRALAARGLGPVLLSGDCDETTRAVAAELGIERYAGRLTPEQKGERIASLQAHGSKVAMVGDGVNDAPSLARADLSITVAGGADVAGQTSDMVLNRANLELVPWFIDASTATRRIMRQNLGWAFMYNAVALPLAAFGVITPGIAAATMASSSLLVVGNSLRLRRTVRMLEDEADRAAVSIPV